MLGLYYQHQPQSVNLQQSIPGITAYDTYTGQPNPTTYGDQIVQYNRSTMFTDKAIFGELTYHLTSAWQVTGGVRFFQQPDTSNVALYLPLCGALCASDQTNPSGLAATSSSTRFSNHVWKANTSYDFSQTLKVYATFSEGFRHGGVSALPIAGPFASPPDLQSFKPDLAKNYEIGVKGSLLYYRINYFADVYLVNLYNFQFDYANLSQVTGAFNGSKARSQGLEFESQMALSDHPNTSLGYAFTRANATKTFNILDYPPYALVPSKGGAGNGVVVLESHSRGSRFARRVASCLECGGQLFALAGSRVRRFHLDGATAAARRAPSIRAASIISRYRPRCSSMPASPWRRAPS